MHEAQQAQAAVQTESPKRKAARPEIVAKLFHMNGEKIPKSKLADLFSQVIEIVTDELAAGNNVHLHGLGTLRLVRREQRVGANPMTGVKITIPAHTVIKLKCVQELCGKVRDVIPPPKK
jgi:integration host factor subunit alpha